MCGRVALRAAGAGSCFRVGSELRRCLRPVANGRGFAAPRGPAEGVGLDCEDLVHSHAARLEGETTAYELQPPDPSSRFPDEVDEVVPTLFQGVVPGGDGAHVVLTQRLNGTHLKARTLQ